MKRFLFVVLAWAAFQPVVALAADPDPEANYQNLLAAAKSGTGPVDWQALRFAYADRPNYVPDADGDDRRAMFIAANAHDWATVLAKANKVLDENYTDGMAHHSAAAADFSLGHRDEGAKEAAMAEGIFQSIRTGDGLSFEHAFTVISVAEEYDLLATMGVDLDQQALSNNDGHVYDVMTVHDDSGKTVVYYFNIDREWAAETKMFAPH